MQQPSPTPGGNTTAPAPPNRSSDMFAPLGDELTAVEREWRALAGPLSAAQFNWRPAPGRWSVGEHLAHLNLVDASYLPHLDGMLTRGRAAGLVARGAARHPWLGWRLVRGVEPPVRLRVRTSRQYVPPSVLDRDAALAEFARIRRALEERIAAAAGVDAGLVRARFAVGIWPANLVVLSFRQWVALTAAHDRRHLWLAKRVIATAGFPAASEARE